MNSYSPDPNFQPTTPQPPPQMVRVRFPSVKPYAVYILMGITILVYLLQEASTLYLGYDLPLGIGVKANELIVQGQLWRLLTPVFLHGSLLHIGFNMYALYVMGPGIERLWGHTRFLALYFLAGFAGNVASFAMSDKLSLGSSTAIFGLLAAEGVFLYRNRAVFAGRTRGALTQIIMVAIVNLAIGLSPGIDNWGHLGGLLGGLIFAWMAAPLLSVEGMAPEYHLQDRRETREVILGAIFVLAVFGLLAGWLIINRQG